MVWRVLTAMNKSVYDKPDYLCRGADEPIYSAPMIDGPMPSFMYPGLYPMETPILLDEPIFVF